MLLIFNPLWSVSEALVVVVWKSLELWVHFCCISFPCGETCSELQDPRVSGNTWILMGLSFQSGPSGGTFLYGKTSAEFRGLSWALHAPCFSPSLSAEIPSMRSRFVLHDAVWAPLKESLSLQRILYILYTILYIILPVIRIQLWSHDKECTGDRKQRKREDGASIQESAAAPNQLAQSHLLQEQGWRLKKSPQDAHKG